MSYVTYNPNQIVYVKNIGYGTLINCGQLKSISRKVSNVNVKKESIYFDPQMFNTHSSSDESNKSNKSHSQEKPIQPASNQKQKLQKQNKPQKQLSKEIQNKQTLKQVKQIIKTQSPTKNEIFSYQNQEKVNIVCVKLQGGNNNNVKIYAPDTLITKTVDLIIKPMMNATREQIVISVEISKTIENLKKLIFTQLNLQMINFFNVRLFSISPIPADLNNNSMKISQYFLKDCSKIVFIADYAFCFNSIKQQNKKRFALSNNSYTLNSCKIVQKPQQAIQKAVNSPQNTQNNPTKLNTQKTTIAIENIADNGQNNQIQVSKNQQIIASSNQQSKIIQNLIILPKLEQKTKSQNSFTQNSSLKLSCAIQIQSGKHYWQFKIDKLPTIQEDYVIGLLWKNLEKKKAETTYWQYNLLTCKKQIIIQYEGYEIVESQLQEDYGLPIKNGDIIGIQVWIKKGQAFITFYKNSNLLMMSLGVCHQIQMKQKNIKKLIPFVAINGESQITLDSRALFPLNSYRNT